MIVLKTPYNVFWKQLMFSLCLPLVLKDALSIILNVLCREGSGGVISLVTCDISLFKENDPVIFCILSSYVHVHYVCLKMILTPTELVALEVLTVLPDFSSFWWWFFLTLIWGFHISSTWPAKELKLKFVHFKNEN